MENWFGLIPYFCLFCFRDYQKLGVPTFILVDGIIESIKIIKNKHYLIFFNNNLGKQIKAICFNSKETILGDYLEKFIYYKFSFACNVTIDKFAAEPVPQLIIRDIMKID